MQLNWPHHTVMHTGSPACRCWGRVANRNRKAGPMAAWQPIGPAPRFGQHGESSQWWHPPEVGINHPDFRFSLYAHWNFSKWLALYCFRYWTDWLQPSAPHKQAGSVQPAGLLSGDSDDICPRIW